MRATCKVASRALTPRNDTFPMMLKTLGKKAKSELIFWTKDGETQKNLADFAATLAAAQ
jgi:hypothetical protein